MKASSREMELVGNRIALSVGIDDCCGCCGDGGLRWLVVSVDAGRTQPNKACNVKESGGRVCFMHVVGFSNCVSIRGFNESPYIAVRHWTLLWFPMSQG